jgi:hypothetical protein
MAAVMPKVDASSSAQAKHKPKSALIMFSRH